MSAIADVLWPGLKAAEPSSLLGGILARKPGYHNSRDHLPSTDYSVAQFAIDRVGPAHKGSAIDWTFPEAQRGDYTRIAKYTRRLLDAAKRRDPRLYAVREFFGNADSDTEVEGWDVAKNRASSSDKSHLWHIHISIHRKYIDDAAAMRALLDVINGVAVPVVPTPPVTPPTTQDWTVKLIMALPTIRRGMKGETVGTAQALCTARGVSCKMDNDFGPATERAVKTVQTRYGAEGKDGIVGPETWTILITGKDSR